MDFGLQEADDRFQPLRGKGGQGRQPSDGLWPLMSRGETLGTFVRCLALVLENLTENLAKRSRACDVTSTEKHILQHYLSIT